MLGAIVALTSCQKDDLSSSGDGREVAVSIAASLPTVMTRSSDQGGLDNIDWTTLSLRYTLEIYDGENIIPISSLDDATQRVIYKESLDDARTAAFNDIRLLSGKDYQFVIWADFVFKNHSELRYTTAHGLGAVSVRGNPNYRMGSDDSWDAYFGSQTVRISNNLTLNLSLTRPFGKLRVITTDIASIRSHVPLDIATEATVTYHTAFPVEFNAVTGNVNSATSVIPASYTAPICELTDQSATLAFDYLFTDPTSVENPVQTAVNFTIECVGVEYNFTSNSVKIERNKLTTVKGNILTKGVDVSITIDDSFDGSLSTDIADEVSTVNSVQDKLDKASSEDGLPVIVKVTSPVAEASTLTIPVDLLVDNTPKLAFDFSAGISDSQTLTIAEAKPEDESTHYTGEVHIAVPSSDAANLVINMPSATVYVNGVLSTLEASVSPNTLVIHQDAQIGTLTINKGNVEIYGAVDVMAFAEGCDSKSLVIGGSISTISGLPADAHVELIVNAKGLLNDFDRIAALSAAARNQTENIRIMAGAYGTLDMKNFVLDHALTIVADKGVYPSIKQIINNQSFKQQLTISGLTFIGGETSARAFDCGKENKLSIKDCKFKIAKSYEGWQNGLLIATGSTSDMQLSIDSCEFDKNGGLYIGWNYGISVLSPTVIYSFTNNKFVGTPILTDPEIDFTNITVAGNTFDKTSMFGICLREAGFDSYEAGLEYYNNVLRVNTRMFAWSLLNTNRFDVDFSNPMSGVAFQVNANKGWIQVTNPLVWDGVSKRPVTAVNKIYSINTPAELAWLVDYLNGGGTAGSIVLNYDIDLGGAQGHSWKPLMKGTSNFDGLYHVINNMRIDAATADGVGFFGTCLNLQVKDVTFRNAYINTNKQYTGVVVGNGYPSMNNVVVENSEVISSQWKVGGLVGQWNEGTMKFTNCHVRNTKVTGTTCVGGLVGFTNYTGAKNPTVRIDGCSASTVKVKGSGETSPFVGSVSSTGDIDYFVMLNVSIENSQIDCPKTPICEYVGDFYWRARAMQIIVDGVVIAEKK